MKPVCFGTKQFSKGSHICKSCVYFEGCRRSTERKVIQVDFNEPPKRICRYCKTEFPNNKQKRCLNCGKR